MLLRVGFSTRLRNLIFNFRWSIISVCKVDSLLVALNSLLRVGTCLVYVMPLILPPHDAHHVWSMTLHELRNEVDDVVDICMVNGDHGWPPQSGGSSLVAKSKIKLVLASRLSRENLM